MPRGKIGSKQLKSRSQKLRVLIGKTIRAVAFYDNNRYQEVTGVLEIKEDNEKPYGYYLNEVHLPLQHTIISQDNHLVVDYSRTLYQGGFKWSA